MSFGRIYVKSKRVHAKFIIVVEEEAVVFRKYLYLHQR